MLSPCHEGTSTSKLNPLWDVQCIRHLHTRNPDGDTERKGTNMMSDEMALLTISGAIVFAVMMLAMLMRET